MEAIDRFQLGYWYLNYKMEAEAEAEAKKIFKMEAEAEAERKFIS